MASDPTGIPPVITLSVADATKVSGFSRSEIYRLLASGDLAAVKLRSRTFIVMDSLRAFLASLPTATFRS
jgi:hypothetical protein